MDMREDLTWLVSYLEGERLTSGATNVRQASEDDLFKRFRDLVNRRDPLPASDEFFVRQDRMLKEKIAHAGIVCASDLPRCRTDNRLSLWRGDITTIDADAIVNAANSRMLGCWVPGHYCIDNAIHTFAGVQLRLECDRIMRAQGHEEPTAHVKVTPAYNLPSRYVLHTVGPIAQGHPSPEHRQQLSACYTRCLDAAASIGCSSIAFCCISTGVFGFPQHQAMPIAIGSVRSWLDAHTDMEIHVIFNVFSARDETSYSEAIRSL